MCQPVWRHFSRLVRGAGAAGESGRGGSASRGWRRWESRWQRASGCSPAICISISSANSRPRTSSPAGCGPRRRAVRKTRKIAAMAEAHYLPVAPHNAGSPVSTMAALHLAVCTTPNFKIQETFDDFSEAWVKESALGLPEVVDGYFALPTGSRPRRHAQRGCDPARTRSRRSTSTCLRRTGTSDQTLVNFCASNSI